MDNGSGDKTRDKRQEMRDKRQEPRERDAAKEARDEKREAHCFMNVLDECRRRTLRENKFVCLP